jgi:uncharacterized protein YdeI (YjbR/CyaY-like superfamily)
MGKTDKRIDAYIAKSADFAKPILTHLRKLAHQACPYMQETIKWSFPHFEYQGVVCSMAAFKQHCAFGFWKASLLRDFEKKLLAQGETAMGHFGRITSLNDLPPDKQILKYIREACRLNEQGLKIVKSKPVVKKALIVPAYFKKELAKHPKARTVFDAFSYSHRKDYVEWITEAKTETTRLKRMSTAIEWLSQGKSRNWKYER